MTKQMLYSLAFKMIWVASSELHESIIGQRLGNCLPADDLSACFVEGEESEAGSRIHVMILMNAPQQELAFPWPSKPPLQVASTLDRCVLDIVGVLPFAREQGRVISLV